MSNDKVKQDAPELIYLHNPWNVEQAPCGCDKDIPYVPETLLATVRKRFVSLSDREIARISSQIVGDVLAQMGVRGTAEERAGADTIAAAWVRKVIERVQEENLAALEAKKGEGNG